MAGEKNRYVQIIKQIFMKHYRKGASEVPFERTDIVETAAAMGIPLPKNLGDIIYCSLAKNG
jgi:phage-related holin